MLIFFDDSIPKPLLIAAAASLMKAQTGYAAMAREYRIGTKLYPWRRVSYAIKIAMRHFGITEPELLDNSREPALVEKRHRIIAFAHIVTGATHSELGRAFNRDHRAIAYACDKYEAEIRAAIGKGDQE